VDIHPLAMAGPQPTNWILGGLRKRGRDGRGKEAKEEKGRKERGGNEINLTHCYFPTLVKSVYCVRG